MDLGVVKKIIESRLFLKGMIAMICGIILFCGYWFDIAELKNQLNVSETVELTLKKEINSLLYAQVYLEENNAELPQIKAMLKEWQAKLIKSKDLLSLLKQIIRTGRANNLHINFFTSDPEVKEDNYFKTPFKLMVVGDYMQTANFIYQVANLPWIVVVGDFTVAKMYQDTRSKLFSTELNLEVYYLKKKS
ncbi:MAG: type 4a pilus biogenesis protein PilO [Gammaproteobacteria bacterium]